MIPSLATTTAIATTTVVQCAPAYSIGTTVVIGMLGSLSAIGLATALRWAIRPATRETREAAEGDRH